MSDTKAPKVGEIYGYSPAPSGLLLVTEVDEEMQTATGWGDAYGHTCSSRHVVLWEALRNTKRKGPFSVVQQQVVDSLRGG